MPENLTPPDVAATFTLSIDQAAQALGVTREELLDLVNAKVIHSLNVPASSTTDRPPLAFSASLLAYDREHYVNETGRQWGAKVLRISRALRRYLARSATENYYDAVAEDRPWLTHGRATDERYAHIPVGRFLEMVNADRDADPTLPVVLSTVVKTVMGQWGCVQRKGLRSPGDAEQHWEPWWRLPSSVYSIAEGAPLWQEPPTSATVAALEHAAARALPATPGQVPEADAWGVPEGYIAQSRERTQAAARTAAFEQRGTSGRRGGGERG